MSTIRSHELFQHMLMVEKLKKLSGETSFETVLGRDNNSTQPRHGYLSNSNFYRFYLTPLANGQALLTLFCGKQNCECLSVKNRIKRSLEPVLKGLNLTMLEGSSIHCGPITFQISSFQGNCLEVIDKIDKNIGCSRKRKKVLSKANREKAQQLSEQLEQNSIFSGNLRDDSSLKVYRIPQPSTELQSSLPIDQSLDSSHSIEEFINMKNDNHSQVQEFEPIESIEQFINSTNDKNNRVLIFKPIETDNPKEASMENSQNQGKEEEYENREEVPVEEEREFAEAAMIDIDPNLINMEQILRFFPLQNANTSYSSPFPSVSESHKRKNTQEDTRNDEVVEDNPRQKIQRNYY